jgi:hypothetical protein
MPSIENHPESTIIADVKRALKSVPSDVLADRIMEYLEESEHMGWDGFTGRDLYGIRSFWTDFCLFVENYD